MTQLCKGFIALLLALALCTGASAADADPVLRGAQDWVCRMVPSPQIASVGGEWAVLGLARGDFAGSGLYFDGYLSRAAQTVTEKSGVLSARRYTEYARFVLALSALGVDARQFAGYDLTLPLGDYEKTVNQGLNGAIFALLALDSADYPMPYNASARLPATRQMYIGAILARQLPSGGWALSGAKPEADITAMALQALAKYRMQPRVAEAVERGIACLSALQTADGGFASDGAVTAESCAQVVLALCELGIQPDDARFVKNGKSVPDALLAFREDGGGFRHLANGPVNQMASEQALLALTALSRAEMGRSTLYDMTDALSAEVATAAFSDIDGHVDRESIEALASLGAVNGRGADRFAPDEGLTRAEFAAILVRAVGLVPQISGAFPDVAEGRWYAPYVGAAYDSGVVKGVAYDRFAPELQITRQEAAVMLFRAAGLCGLDIASAGGYDGVPAWAGKGVAWCVEQGVLPAGELRPAEAVTRGEMARMIVSMLELANMV